MNAKKAKALRKLLKNLQDHQDTNLPAHGFVTVKNTDKHVMMEKEKENGAVGVEKVCLFQGQQRVAPRSERAVYLHLKKEMRKAEAEKK